MDEITEKKKDKQLNYVPLQQDICKLFDDFTIPQYFEPTSYVKRPDAKCGPYAAAMAIASLIFSRTFTPSGMKAVIIQIAEKISEIAKSASISSIGEIFDVDALAAAINTFSGDLFLDEEGTESIWGKKLLAKTTSFNNKEELKNILIAAQNRGIKVLIAYYAGNDFKPTLPNEKEMDNSTKRLKPRYMTNAHWSAVENFTSENGQIQLREASSQGSLIHNSTIQQLFESNSILGDTLDWKPYLNKNSQNQKDVVNRAEHLKPSGQLQFYISEEQKNRLEVKKDDQREVTPILSEKDLVEQVSLRGKVILVGHEKIEKSLRDEKKSNKDTDNLKRKKKDTEKEDKSIKKRYVPFKYLVSFIWIFYKGKTCPLRCG